MRNNLLCQSAHSILVAFMFYEVDSTKLYILACMCFLKTQVGGTRFYWPLRNANPWRQFTRSSLSHVTSSAATSTEFFLFLLYRFRLCSHSFALPIHVPIIRLITLMTHTSKFSRYFLVSLDKWRN